MKNSRRHLEERDSSRRNAAITIITEEFTFKVHKHIMTMHSEILKNMLRNKNSDDFMTIYDCSSGAVQELIKVLNTGDLEDSENPVELYELAGNYGVEGLQVICEEIILEDLKKSNSRTVFDFGVRHGNKNLKKAGTNEDKAPGESSSG